jgi:hypothetical protein
VGRGSLLEVIGLEQQITPEADLAPLKKVLFGYKITTITTTTTTIPISISIPIP